MISTIINMILFVSFMGSAAYILGAGYWLCRYLRVKYPDYYEKAGRPTLEIFNIRWIILAEGILTKLFFGGVPKDFPQDKLIKDRIGRIQLVWLLITLPAWLGLIVMLFRDMYSY